jgi:hypothetical protein
MVYQYRHLTPQEASKQLGGLTALAKANAGMILNECVQCAQLLFGGNGYTQSGKGELIEKISREVAGARVPVRCDGNCCTRADADKLYREAVKTSCSISAFASF